MSEEHFSLDSADENPVLQKQFGCVASIFHVFGSHLVLPGKWFGCHNHKKLHSGNSHSNDVKVNEKAITSQKKAKETSSSKSQNDERTSVNSSSASFSSSTSTSLASFPLGRATHSNCSIINSQMIDILDMNSKPTTYPHFQVCHAKSSQDSIDLQDVVKDSVYGGHWSSDNNNTIEELENHVRMHKDFLKPLQYSRDGADVAGICEKLRMLEGNESTRIQEKLTGALCYHGSARKSPRLSRDVNSASLFSASLETRRFSYDGQTIPHTSSVSRETCKSTIKKLRELPRLSLDSRECSMRNFNYNLKTNTVLEDLKQSSDVLKVSNNGKSSTQKESGNWERYPSVIAKLMGLDAMPDSSSAVHGQIGQVESHVDEAIDLPKDESSRQFKERKHHQRSWYQGSSLKWHISPQEINSEVVKPILSPRFQIKTAPSLRDRSCSPRGTAFRIQDAPADEALDVLESELSRKIKETNQNRSSRSPRNSLSGNISPQLRNSEVSNPILSSRTQHETTYVIEIAEALPTKPLSVYGEMEKRFEELEFQQSSKDLRALKHILKATQVKRLTETKKVEASYHGSHKNHNNQNQNKFDQNPNPENSRTSQNDRPISSPTRRTNKAGDQFPKVIRRPEFIEKSSISTSSAIPLDRSLYHNSKSRSATAVHRKNVLLDNQTCKSPIAEFGFRESGTRIVSTVDKKISGRNRAYGSQKPRPQSMQELSRPQTSTRENVVSLACSSGSLSPRMQQRKIELEKRCNLPTCSSGLIKPSSKQPIVHQVELDSPGRKQRLKSDYLHKDGQSNQLCNKARNLNCEVNVITRRSQCNISMGLDRDGEIMRGEKPSEMHCTSIQHGCQRTSDGTVLSLEHERSMLSSKDIFPVEFATAVTEQPSPVSVLDSSFDEDALSPSPLKKISNSFHGEEECSIKGVDYRSNNVKHGYISRIDDKNLKNIEHIVLKPTKLNLDNFESFTGFSFLCEDTNPDHTYISEILLASGLLDECHNSSLTQLHPSGNLINPNLFMEMEETKVRCIPKAGSARKKILQPKFNREKLHRKFVFDAVNEILTGRFEMEAEPWLQVNKLVRLLPTGRRLVRELCLEIDWLIADKSNDSNIEDDAMMSGLERWVDFRKESPRIVLDIERLIFKDMIGEAISHLTSN